MSAVSLPPPERARKNERTILSALASAGQRNLAKDMGIDESTVSRMKQGDITTFSTVLAHLGLKAVPVSMRCYSPEYVEALQTLARVGIRHEGPRLDWEEEA